jgi:hypothetical protein
MINESTSFVRVSIPNGDCPLIFPSSNTVGALALYCCLENLLEWRGLAAADCTVNGFAGDLNKCCLLYQARDRKAAMAWIWAELFRLKLQEFSTVGFFDPAEGVFRDRWPDSGSIFTVQQLAECYTQKDQIISSIGLDAFRRGIQAFSKLQKIGGGDPNV